MVSHCIDRTIWHHPADHSVACIHVFSHTLVWLDGSLWCYRALLQGLFWHHYACIYYSPFIVHNCMKMYSLEPFLINNFFINLIHWGWVMHICISKLTIIGSDNDLSPGRHQAIIWINIGILLIGPLGTNSVKYKSNFFFQEKAFENVVRKLGAILSRPQCVNVEILQFTCTGGVYNVFCKFKVLGAILSWPQCVNIEILRFTCTGGVYNFFCEFKVYFFPAVPLLWFLLLYLTFLQWKSVVLTLWIHKCSYPNFTLSLMEVYEISRVLTIEIG